jgi:anti-sigma factor RsiW
VRCQDLDELIEGVAAGDPVPADAEAHLAGCAACRTRVELARAVDRLLHAREVPAAPEGFTLQVMRRVRQERWRVEQFVDAGFNAAIAAGVLVALAGVAGVLWSFGWFSIDVAALTAATSAIAPWTTHLAAEARTLGVAAVLLSSALALWWWMEGEAV